MVYQLGPWRRPLALLAAAALLLVVGVPLGNLFYKAGQQVVATSEGLLRTWSPSKCLAMIGQAPWRLRREFGWSLLIGSLAATADLLLAIPLAWIARRGGWRAVPTLLLTALCLAMPGPVVGLVVIALLNRPEVPLLATLYDRSILAPWLALAIRGLPAATVVLWHALGTVPEELLESAALDGAGPLRGFAASACGCGWPPWASPGWRPSPWPWATWPPAFCGAAGRDHAFHPHFRPLALRGRGSGGRRMSGVDRTVSRPGRPGRGPRRPLAAEGPRTRYGIMRPPRDRSQISNFKSQI